MSGVHSKSLQFVKADDVFFHWVSCTTAMFHTTAAVDAYIEKTSKDFLNTWPHVERNGLQHFIKDNFSSSGEELKVRKCSCIVCTNIYKSLTEEQRYDTQPIVLFKPQSNDWWTVLLFYLPAGWNAVQDLQRCDKRTLRRILERCLLFEKFPMEQFEKVMGIRNKLMHSATYVVKSEDKKSYFCEMTALLHMLKSEETIEKVLKTELGCANSFESLDDELENAIKLQIDVIERDMEHINSLPKPLRNQIFKELDLPQIKSVARNNRRLLQNLQVVENERTATLQQLIEMGAQAGAEEVGADNIISEAIGRFGGAVGARAGGLYRKFFEN